MNDLHFNPGPIVLMGSGETSPGSGAVFEDVIKQYSTGARINILETPAGFELNSKWVAGRVGDFLQNRLQNYKPVIDIIPARKKGTEYSPDNRHILEPLYSADMIFLGPGSPTYTARELSGTLAYEIIQAKQRNGTALVLASAATIAFGCQTMPVYEIYKAGMDLHWQPGLNFLGQYGLSLVIIPHWNNNEGGAELDTSHCFMGKTRFDELRKLLDCSGTILGIDEHTSVWIDLNSNSAWVYGKGSIHLISGKEKKAISSGQTVQLSEFGTYSPPYDWKSGVREEVWKMVQLGMQQERSKALAEPPEEILAMAEQRHKAREAGDYDQADRLRDEIQFAGWSIKDTPAGPELEPLK